MLFCWHYFVGFFVSKSVKTICIFIFVFTPFNKGSETEGKGLQNSGQTSSVVWCRDLGNNERTRSTTRSKWDEDAKMDVRSDKEG